MLPHQEMELGSIALQEVVLQCTEAPLPNLLQVIVGDNTGAGEAIVGRTTSDIAGAVVGRNDGGGYGIRGFVATSTAGTGIGVYGQVGLNNSTGRAGRFENFNQTNTEANTFEVQSNGNGNIPDNTLGRCRFFCTR